MDNTFKNTDIGLGKDELRSPLPNYCCFVVTLRCMMRCKMCYIWKSNEESLNELTIQEWKSAVSSLKRVLDTQYDIIFSGGEPLLKKGILDLVYFSAQLGYKVSIDTNAYLIDRELAKAIRDSGLWRICLSLDSLNGSTHDFLRGEKSSYYRVIRAIEYLHKFSPSVGINIQTVIMKQNLNELVKLAEWVEQDERLDYIYFQILVRPFGAAVDDYWFRKSDYNFLWPQDLKKVNSVIDELIRMKHINSKIANTISQLRAYMVYFGDPINFGKNIDCTMGNRALNINPYGDVYLCFAKEPIGNVRTEDVRKIWYSKKAAKIRNEMNKCKNYCHFLLNCSFEERDILNRIFV